MKNLFLASLFASCISATNLVEASTPIIISHCDTTAKCSDTNLKATAIAEAGGRESDVIFYDKVSDKSLHYKVIDVGGLEFPGMLVMGSLRVGELDRDTNDAISEFVDIYENGIYKLLGENYGNIGRVGAYEAYSLAKFDANITVADLASSFPNLAYRISAQLSSQYSASFASIVDRLGISLSASFGNSTYNIAGGLSISASDSAKVFLKSNNGSNSWGLVTTFKLVGNNIEATIEKVVVMQSNGDVIFEIPVINNNLDIGALIGQSFNTTNPGSLRSWFQNINLDLRWYSCTAICNVTITDIDDSDVGEVEKP